MPTTVSAAKASRSAATRMTTRVSASVAPRSTPQASATPGAAKASAEPCTSRATVGGHCAVGTSQLR